MILSLSKDQTRIVQSAIEKKAADEYTQTEAMSLGKKYTRQRERRAYILGCHEGIEIHKAQQVAKYAKLSLLLKMMENCRIKDELIEALGET